MAKFQKRPLEVEAVQVKTEVMSYFTEHPIWLSKAYDNGTLTSKIGPNGQLILVKTPEGTMIAHDRDWIVRGITGEIYPCKPEIFAATYDPLED